MDFKIAGESMVRDLYAASGGPGLAYTIVRPGGLNDKPSVGPEKVHVSQGMKWVFSFFYPRSCTSLTPIYFSPCALLVLR
jgi:hypothetical protein